MMKSEKRREKSGCKQIMNTYRCRLLQKYQPEQRKKLQSQMLVFSLSPAHANANARQLEAVASRRI